MSDFKFVKSFSCDCGHVHETDVEDVIIGKGVLKNIPEVVKRYGKTKVFLYDDMNTEKACGTKVKEILREANIPFSSYTYKESPKPNEEAVGSVMMHFDPSADFIIGVGSGVLNDIGKILAKVSGLPFMIVATAPSMDGYASGSSSMVRDNLKISLSFGSPKVILGDVDILKDAPIRMLKSGLGDMLAKYISIGEWRVSQVINGEYFCETIADMIRKAVKKCVDNADGLLKRDDKAVEAVFEGLIIGGVAMSYAGVSRPASGGEHYMSHMWDMRSLMFGTVEDFHGIQCAIATNYMAGLYEIIRKTVPDREKALKKVAAFDLSDWNEKLRAFLKDCAEPMIELEKKEGKYNKEAHERRLTKIIDSWQDILRVIEEEIPTKAYIENILTAIDAPKTVEEIGIEKSVLPMTFMAAKDMRDKYVLPRLFWDLGILEETAEKYFA